MAPPLLQDGAARRAGLDTGSRYQTVRSIRVDFACEHFAQPAQNQLQPLLTQQDQDEDLLNKQRLVKTRQDVTELFHLLELQQEGALVLAPAVLLHSLLNELVNDGGDGL